MSAKKPQKEKVIVYLYSIYSRNARNRDIDFLLTKDQVSSLIFLPCVYCGEVGSMQTARVGGNCIGEGIPHNGIDRVNSSLPYTKENCVSCCKFCNHAKNSRSVEDYISWAKAIYQNMIDKTP